MGAWGEIAADERLGLMPYIRAAASSGLVVGAGVAVEAGKSGTAVGASGDVIASVARAEADGAVNVAGDPVDISPRMEVEVMKDVHITSQPGQGEMKCRESDKVNEEKKENISRVEAETSVQEISKDSKGGENAVENAESILPQPLLSQVDAGTVGKLDGENDSTLAARFLTRRLRLLETALLLEEQLEIGETSRRQVDPESDVLACMYAVEELHQRIELMRPALTLMLSGDVNAGVAFRKGEDRGMNTLLLVCMCLLRVLIHTCLLRSIILQTLSISISCLLSLFFFLFFSLTFLLLLLLLLLLLPLSLSLSLSLSFFLSYQALRALESVAGDAKTQLGLLGERLSGKVVRED